jgi:Flp pilus assembly protein protease CpaA
MSIGASLLLIAVGAILAFAITADVSGVDIQVVGWILMAAGGLGLLISLLFWSLGGGGRGPHDGPPPPPY